MKAIIGILSFAVMGSFIVSHAQSQSNAANADARWTKSFDTENRRFATVGENRYFILKPTYQLVYVGIKGKDTTELVVTVLEETKKIGNVETRVVEEKEAINGQVIEISRNYYAFCRQSATIFYFGEDVDNFKNGLVANHEGSWRADGPEASAGIMIPGIPLLGSRYYQEIAPDIAMDRSEIVSLTESVNTWAGRFTQCIKTEETTPLEPSVKESKLYAPGIGLVKDGNLALVKYGLLKKL